MNIHSTKNFLGNTSNRLEATNFKVSLVNYTQKVSEEWHYHEDIHLYFYHSGRKSGISDKRRYSGTSRKGYVI